LTGPGLTENEAHQQGADLKWVFNQYGQRDEEDCREVTPPIDWRRPGGQPDGSFDCWVKERREWWWWW
jgi:hypothetical protein